MYRCKFCLFQTGAKSVLVRHVKTYHSPQVSDHIAASEGDDDIFFNLMTGAVIAEVVSDSIDTTFVDQPATDVSDSPAPDVVPDDSPTFDPGGGDSGGGGTSSDW